MSNDEEKEFHKSLEKSNDEEYFHKNEDKFQRSFKMSNDEENFHKNEEMFHIEEKRMEMSNKNEEKFQKSLEKSNDEVKNFNYEEEKFHKSLEMFNDEEHFHDNEEKSKETKKKMILIREDNYSKGPSKEYEMTRRKIRRDLDEFWFFVRAKFEQGVQQATCGRGKVRLG